MKKQKACKMWPTLCARHEQIHTALRNMHHLALIFQMKTKLGATILGEAVRANWAVLKRTMPKVRPVIDCMRKSPLWKTARVRELLTFIFNNIPLSPTPLSTIAFLEKLFSRKQTEAEIRTLQEIFSSKATCLHAGRA